MNNKLILTAFVIVIVNLGCRDNAEVQSDSTKNNPIPVGENSFVYKDKVYKIINNELLQIGDLKDTAIRKLKISTSELKTLGKSNLDYIKKDAEGSITSVYRGNILYFKLKLFGINDLKEKYLPGVFTIEFIDDFGFTIYKTDVNTNELIGEVLDGVIIEYEYNGKIEISMDAQAAISRIGITSSVKKRGK
jgi:hypothetical protein